MSDLQNYFKATVEVEAAKNLLNYANANYELAKIRERAAEIKSQCEPLESMERSGMGVRDCAEAIVHYVMTGLIPKTNEA